MDENRFDENENIGRTREIDSILSESAQRGITPREQFTEQNAAEDIGRTKAMDSLPSEETDGAGADYDDYDEEDSRPAPNPVKKRRKRSKKHQTNHTRTMGQIFLGVLLSVGAVIAGIALSFRVLTAIKDFTGMAKPSREAEVEITDSMNVDDIAEILHDKGIIEMPSLFKSYLKVAKKETGFLNGEYILNSGMSYQNIVTALKTKKTYTETVMVMIPEGATAQQIGQLLEENYVCRAADFELFYKSKANKYDFEESIPDNPDRFYALEGYLFPDTYEFYVIDDLKDNSGFDTLEYAQRAAEKMYANFENKITRDMKSRMDELGMTLDETIILASIIQKEGKTAEDMNMISSVFHNRLADPVGFPMLQTDTTYTYIDECIKPKIPANAGDLYDSVIAAYDTYSCEGLPAGAVCNPGLEAINAALYPDETDYYYFLASSDGVFYFASTVEQHEQNIIDAALRDEE